MAAEVDHEQWMRHALDLARRGSGHVSPNPRVGCVVVHNGSVIADGWHAKFGEPHAEAMALSRLPKPPADATLYVSMEPCNHQGKTPPCTDAILESGIKNVVVGMTDPNPQVRGGGIQRLRQNGVKVVEGVLEEECMWMNRWFIKHTTTDEPYVLLKLATSVDGVIAPDPPRKDQLTGQATMQTVHGLRNELDAVMVGVRTVIVDDPKLTVRMVDGRHPKRVIVDPDLELPLDSYVAKNVAEAQTFLICSPDAPAEGRDKLSALGIQIIEAPIIDGQLRLRHAFKELAQHGIASILCEGGALLATRLVQAGLVDEYRLHLAGKLRGSGLRVTTPETRPLIGFELRSVERSENDIMATYIPLKR